MEEIVPSLGRMTPGKWKWAAMAGVIIVLEAVPGDTLTTAHVKAIEHPHNKKALLVTHAFIVLHLWGAIPKRFDPLILAAEKLRDWRM